ncbi:MAG: aminoglycoside phosphotransferase, partial [Clostridia bacterium]|nr:aminoglycoside phosphotransferase [Clostridia bacterium]
MKLDTVIAKRINKTVYRDGNLAIKVFEKEFKTSDVLNEALNLARVAETDLNIPKLQEVTKIDGKWAIVTDFVEGKTLAQLMEENPDKTDKYLEMFVDLQLEIHKHSVHHLNKLKDKMTRKISESGLDATTRYELNTRLEGMPKHKKL